MGVILFFGVAVVAVGTVVYFFKQKSISTETHKGNINLSEACGSLDLCNAKSECIDSLHFEDIIKWFQSMGLKKEQHIPFVLNNLPDEIKRENFSVLLLGILDNSNDEIREYDLIYYKETDEKVKDMLSHADNGIVVLG